MKKFLKEFFGWAYFAAGLVGCWMWVITDFRFLKMDVESERFYTIYGLLLMQMSFSGLWFLSEREKEKK